MAECECSEKNSWKSQTSFVNVLYEYIRLLRLLGLAKKHFGLHSPRKVRGHQPGLDGKPRVMNHQLHRTAVHMAIVTAVVVVVLLGTITSV